MIKTTFFKHELIVFLTCFLITSCNDDINEQDYFFSNDSTD